MGPTKRIPPMCHSWSLFPLEPWCSIVRDSHARLDRMIQSLVPGETCLAAIVTHLVFAVSAIPCKSVSRRFGDKFGSRHLCVAARIICGMNHGEESLTAQLKIRCLCDSACKLPSDGTDFEQAPFTRSVFDDLFLQSSKQFSSGHFTHLLPVTDE